MVVYRDRPTYTCRTNYVLSNRIDGGFSTDTVNSITCNLNAAQNDGLYTPRATVCVSKFENRPRHRWVQRALRTAALTTSCYPTLAA